MTSNRKNLVVLFGVAAGTAAASALWLNAAGVNDENISLVLRITARAAFMLFLLVFVARPLRQLFPNTATRWLLGERRSIGIAFAAMHSVHLGLVAYRYNVVPDMDFTPSGSAPGMIAYALIYVMLITSFNAPARALGPKNWRRLHKTGLYYVGFIFLATLLPAEGEPIFTFERAWFVTLTALAAFLRLTAYFAKRNARVSA